MRPQGFLIAAAFAALSVAIWAYVNQPEAEPEWPQKVQGFAFSPYQADQDALLEQFPTAEQIGSDLDLLKGKTVAVRTYSTIGSLDLVPELAAARGINVTVGAWIDTRFERNEIELEGAIRLAKTHRNVVRVIAGNEVLLRGDMPVPQLIAYLDRARKEVGQPVSTAEPWHVWLKNPELADHVDFIAVHLLPYWEGIDVEQAIQRSIDSVKQLHARFPDKQIVIGEVGWPSNGRTRESAVASASNEALFLRRFLAWAEKEGYVYYIMEAFDQPWKGNVEGAVGAYWGVYDAQRNPKFEFTKPIVRVPEWHVLAAISVVLAAIMLFVFYINSGTLRNRGRTFLALIVYATSALTTWVVYDYTQQYLTMTSVAVGLLLLIGMVGVIAVLMAEAHEWAEAHWVRMRRRLFASEAMYASDYRPKVSIHVPAYNEPPTMVIETLDALANLDYPDFEVLVIDNNTPDEATWRPVEAHCAALGPRFRFIHVDGLEGFKAGALNLALRETAPDAEIVAVIDSDYVVVPEWLRSLVPAFADPLMSIVQAPQDYRDEGASAFKAMCHAEYRGFFHIGMVTRNERNAIIQHGTMTLVRRRALEESGAWAEWCITEDAELGLRLFERGYDATYIPQSFGKGLMPDTFIDFKKQRFRWAYGAMQILRKHAKELLGPEPTQLSSGQRYHFIAGWLPWLADGFNLFFNFSALVWTVLMVVAPTEIDPPLAVFSVLPLSLFAFKLIKLMHLYRVRVGAGIRQTFAASLAGLALSHTIGIAVIKGLFTNSEPFFRTPKNAQTASVWGALAAAREELLMVVAMWSAAWAVMQTPLMSSPDLSAWIIVLSVQSIPYLSAVVVSIISALPWPASLVGTGYRSVEAEEPPQTVITTVNSLVEPAAPAP